MWTRQGPGLAAQYINLIVISITYALQFTAHLPAVAVNYKSCLPSEAHLSHVSIISVLIFFDLLYFCLTTAY